MAKLVSQPRPNQPFDHDIHEESEIQPSPAVNVFGIALIVLLLAAAVILTLATLQA
jgi:hypothetical protein